MCANKTRRILVPFCLAMLWAGSEAVYSSDLVSIGMTGMIQAPACTLNSTPSELEQLSQGETIAVVMSCPESEKLLMQTMVHSSSDITLKSADNSNGELNQEVNILRFAVSQQRAGASESSGNEGPQLMIDYP